MWEEGKGLVPIIWYHIVLYFVVHLDWGWHYLCYGDKVWAQEDTLDTINSEQLSEGRMEKHGNSFIYILQHFKHNHNIFSVKILFDTGYVKKKN